MKINDITLQEGYMLRLERDYNADMLVLHVKDTKTGRRSEVRGKLGYETDGYDDNDPLHQLLDKVGRSASVSDMMNGDVVHINPKHPQGPDAEKAANKVTSESQLNELFDRPYALSWQTQGVLSAARFQTDNGHEYMVRFEPMSKGSKNYETSFSMRNEHGDNEVKRTGMGDEYRVFSSVISAIKQFMNEHLEVESIQFDAHREGEARTSKDIKDSRIELYKKLVKKFATANNFEYADQAIARMHKFMLRRPNETVSEDTKDEILQRIRKKQYQDFIESMLESIHKLVQKHGDRHSIGHYAFEIGRVYGLEGRKIEKMYKDKYEIKESINESEEYKIPITSEMQQLNKLFTKNKFEIRIVGGAVRDVVLNKAPKDIDLATDATPVEMQKMFDSAGIKHIPSGIEHGTITAIINGEEFEITTLRSDAETDGRHAKVEFVRSWEQDALRRDLTYNAMSMDFDGNLFDYHNGMDDLQNKVSRFVGDPAERIQEDYLRILRYFRFQGRLDNPKFEKETLQAIKANATGLTKVSVERVWMEMGKILSGNNIAKILTAMSSTGILKTIGLSNKNISAMVDGDYELVNLARLGDASIGKRWKLSNVDNNILKFLVEHANSPIDEKILSDMIVDGTPKILLYRWAQMLGKYEIFANHIKSFEAPVFPVNGNDLIQAGFKKGPDLGKKLNLLKQKWKQSGYKATKDQLLGESTQKIDEKLKSKKYKKSYKAAKASGRRRRKKLRDDVTESLDSVLPYTITHSSEFNFEGKSSAMLTALAAGKTAWSARDNSSAPTILVSINDFHEDGNWEISFSVDGSIQTTGGGRAHQIFATVIAIIKVWWSLRHPITPVKSIEFSASKENAGGRERLYQRFGKQFAAAIGFRLTKKSIHAGSTTNFLLVNPKKKDEPGYEPVPENFADGKKFVEPNLDFEWEEANRYPEFAKIGKEAWIELASKGKAVTIKSAKGINNTDASDLDSFKSLDPNKQKRALAQLEKGKIEMPVVAVYSDGYKELIGGNTRLTAMMARDSQATVWAFRVPDEVATLAENFADGKKKGKSRPGRVKKSGASCNGSVTALRKRAKNASGEKARMYHWCANMKGGKK